MEAEKCWKGTSSEMTSVFDENQEAATLYERIRVIDPCSFALDTDKVHANAC